MPDHNYFANLIWQIADLLRLRYQMTGESKARFSDTCPHLLDNVRAIDQDLGREPQRNWNAVWARIEEVLRVHKSRWKTSEQKLFRSVFTQKDPEAEPVRFPSPVGSIGARRPPLSHWKGPG